MNDNRLYFINPTLRNPDRILDFWLLSLDCVDLVGSEEKSTIFFEQFKNLIESKYTNILTLKDSNNLESFYDAFSRRFSELNKLELIKFQNNNKSFVFTKTSLNPTLFNLENINKDLNNDINSLENFSNFFLFLLKKRNILNFIYSIIKKTELKWKNNNGKRIGVSNIELQYAYVVYYFKEFKLSSEDISNLIIELRKEYKTKDKKSILSYNKFIENSLSINQELQKISLSKNNKKTAEENIKTKLNNAKDYIDVLIRTLVLTNCFYTKHQFHMKSININEYFFSKLSYFLSHDLKYLEEKILNQRLSKDIKSHESNYYNLIEKNKMFFDSFAFNLIDSENSNYDYNYNLFFNNFNKKLAFISNNDEIYINHRYNKLEKNKKLTYISNNNIEEEYKDIEDFCKKFKENPYWSDFEHLNNLIICHYIKYQLGIFINEENINYAIKIDHEGNHANSTTSGIEDFSFIGEDIVVSIESSRLNGLNARKNEIEPVQNHSINLYTKHKKPVLTFIVLDHKISEEFQHSYISKNLHNKISAQDIYYLPLCFSDFKNNFLNNKKSTIFRFMDILNEIKDKTHIIKNENFEFKYNTFKEFNLQTIKLH